jgi:ribokinase
MTRVAVVGHVEWVEFLGVDSYPARGTIEPARHERRGAGGGAVVAAAVLAELGAETEFFCAVGDDDLGAAAVAELEARGIIVHAARRPSPTREALTLLDGGGERTILTIGDRLAPHGEDDLEWGELARADGVYLTAGDATAMRRARAARSLVTTPRMSEQLDPELEIDALVFSASDPDEVKWADGLSDRCRLKVATNGSAGGRWWGESEGTWQAGEPPGPVRDSYGAGDAFAAGFTFGLAQGLGPAGAAAIGARCGAEMLARIGAP